MLKMASTETKRRELGQILPFRLEKEPILMTCGLLPPRLTDHEFLFKPLSLQDFVTTALGN